MTHTVNVMAKKSSNQPKRITNRKARFDYELGDSIVAGIVLSGVETKALRMGHGHLRGAYVTVKDGELWLFNSTITGTTSALLNEQEQTRSRKLLANKREITHLIAAKEQGLVIVPTEILTQGRYVKVRIAIGKGKKRYDKRQTIRKREEQRKISGAMKSSYK